MSLITDVYASFVSANTVSSNSHGASEISIEGALRMTVVRGYATVGADSSTATFDDIIFLPGQMPSALKLTFSSLPAHAGEGEDMFVRFIGTGYNPSLLATNWSETGSTDYAAPITADRLTFSQMLSGGAGMGPSVFDTLVYSDSQRTLTVTLATPVTAPVGVAAILFYAEL
jgi:hypothetical protein